MAAVEMGEKVSSSDIQWDLRRTQVLMKKARMSHVP